MDLSPSGVRSALSRIGDGPSLGDPHDQSHLEIFEREAHHTWGELEWARRDPYCHIDNLDVSTYDRSYAPAAQRAAARLAHLAAWPDAVSASLESLDRVPAPVATALMSSATGLADLITGDSPLEVAALAAQGRLVARLESLAAAGDPDAAIGEAALARLMGIGEGMVIDLGVLALKADAERTRLLDLATEMAGRIDPDVSVAELTARLGSDHPSATGLYPAASDLIDELTAYTMRRNLLPELGGTCEVGPAPPSRMSAFAMMGWTAPFEDEAPAVYYVTPPDLSWSPQEQEEWLCAFNSTTLPAITAHEVTPGHYAHARMMRRLESPVRKSLMSYAFVEGWAHYAEELMVEERFRIYDPRFALGVYTEALVRVTRLRAAIGYHSGTMTLEEVARTFVEDSFLTPTAARSEAERATYDPGYGAYTLGKLAIVDLREQAKSEWQGYYSHRRFHEALLSLGSPPLGLIGATLDIGRQVKKAA